MGSRFYSWLDSRTGITSVLEFAILKKIPGNVSWFHTLGTTSLFLFTVQVVTGIFLAMFYVPSLDEAHRSVVYLSEQVLWGDFIRGLHFYGASFMVAVVTLHMLRVTFYGAYKKPREMTWLVGVLILICTMALGLSGYLLPWDQKAYYATKVVMRIIESEPLTGPLQRAILQGGPGDAMGASTLTHFFAFHTMVLPMTMMLLIGVHLWLVLRNGIATPWVAEDHERPRNHNFWPGHVLKDTVIVTLTFVLMLVSYFTLGTHLDDEAYTLDALGYLPRPEWYFMWLFELLKIFEGPLIIVGTIIIPTLILIFLFLLPWLDRGKSRHPKDRKPIMIIGGVMIVAIIGLTVKTYMDDAAHETEAFNKIAAEHGDMESAEDREHLHQLMHERNNFMIVKPGLSVGEEQSRDNFKKFGCIACHIMNGLGGDHTLRAPSLTFIGDRRTAEQIHKKIIDGGAGFTVSGAKMPKWEEIVHTYMPTASKEEQDKVLADMVSWLSKTKDPEREKKLKMNPPFGSARIP